MRLINSSLYKKPDGICFCFFTFERMKSRWLRIGSSVLLIGTLLFAQVAINFFHRNHDIHKLKSATAHPLKNGEAGVQSHDGEHCKVCAVDFFNHAFEFKDSCCLEPVFYSIQLNHFSSSYLHVSLSFEQGRAPPCLLI